MWVIYSMVGGLVALMLFQSIVGLCIKISRRGRRFDSDGIEIT